MTKHTYTWLEHKVDVRNAFRDGLFWGLAMGVLSGGVVVIVLTSGG